MNCVVSEGWRRVSYAVPVDGAIVDTKIDDEHGCRNVQKLKYHKRLWWLTDMSMYVYYTPTHWKYV